MQGISSAKRFMVDLVEGETVVCDLTQERTHGRRVGGCYRDGRDIAAELIRAGLARDCPHFSGACYRAVERQASANGSTIRENYALPGYCR